MFEVLGLFTTFYAYNVRMLYTTLKLTLHEKRKGQRYIYMLLGRPKDFRLLVKYTTDIISINYIGS
jgi:hypothetical protein